MKEKLSVRELDVPRIKDLDAKSLEEVSELLEQEGQKCSIDYQNWSNEYPYHPVTISTIAYSDKYLYVDFFVRGNYLRAVNYKNNTPVADDSCVEFFMQIPGSPEYWNFEFNCIGTVNASHRERRENPTRLNDAQIDSIKRYASCGTKPFEEMEGLFAWTLTIAIPFELVGLDGNNLPDHILGNFYKCGSKTSLPHFLSWSPIDTPAPDFHRPDFFGKINLR